MHLRALACFEGQRRKSIFSAALVNLLKFLVVPEALTARPAESSRMGLHKLGYGELGVCAL